MTADAPTGITPRTSPRWTRAAALAGLTLAAVVACYFLLAPFLPGVGSGLALAAVGLPMHRWIRRHVPHDDVAAGLSVGLIVLLFLVPLGLVTAQLAVEAKAGAELIEQKTAGGRWREYVAQVPYLHDWVTRLEAQDISFEAEARALVARMGSSTLGAAQGVLAGLLQLLVALFVAYFGFRDHRYLLDGVRRYLPLDRADADRVIRRVDEAVYATVYGTLLAGVLQGVTGGLVFWALGLPAPVLWGVVMAVLAVLPVVGAVLVWAPAAVFLVSDGRVGAAALLVAWGTLMAGPVGNYVYAVAAGGRMHMHPVPALLAFVGGLAVFGVAGMVLGPAVLAGCVALLDVWRERVSPATPMVQTA